MRDAQTIEFPRPVWQADLRLYHAKIVVQLHTGQRKDKRRPSAQDTKVLEELPPLGRNQGRRGDSLLGQHPVEYPSHQAATQPSKVEQRVAKEQQAMRAEPDRADPGDARAMHNWDGVPRTSGEELSDHQAVKKDAESGEQAAAGGGTWMRAQESFQMGVEPQACIGERHEGDRNYQKEEERTPKDKHPQDQGG